jgi:hypothetical protein
MPTPVPLQAMSMPGSTIGYVFERSRTRRRSAVADVTEAIAIGAVVRSGRAVGIGGLAGVLAGIAVAGIGGRVLMRVSAVLAGPASIGMRTDNGNIVGEITLPGTIALVAFAGVANGLIGGLVYAALRPWLAPLGRRGALGFGVLLLAVLGFVVITPENPDFRRFGPAAVNIAMFAVIYVLFGTLLVSLHAALDRFTPGGPQGRPTGIGGIALATAAGLAGLLSLFVFTALVITTASTIAGTAAQGTGFGLTNSLVTIGLIGAGLIARTLPHSAGRVVLAIPIAAGLWLTTMSIVEILAP